MKQLSDCQINGREQMKKGEKKLLTKKERDALEYLRRHKTKAYQVTEYIGEGEES